MSATYKSVAQLRELVDLLKKELTTATFEVDSFDANGNPVATFSHSSTPTAGEANVVIRIQPIGAVGATDSLGNTQNDFSHHRVQLCTEAGSVSGTDVNSPAFLLPLIVECGRLGMFVEWYESATTVVPTVAAMIAGNLKATWRPLYWNVLAAI